MEYMVKANMLNTLISVPATAFLALVLSILSSPTRVAAQDFAKQQLAASGNPEHREAVITRARAYEDRSASLDTQIRSLNRTTGILGGVVAGAIGGVVLTKHPGGAVGGAFLGAMARVAIEDSLNRSLLDKSTQLTLTDARAQDRALFDDFIASAPGSDQRSLLTRQIVDRAPYMELLRDLEDDDSRAGPLLEHTASLEEYLLGLDAGTHAGLGSMTDREAVVWVERELPDLERAAVEYTQKLQEGRTKVFQLAKDWNDIAERINAQGTQDASPQPDLPPDRDEIVVVPDRIFTERGDVLNMSGDKIGEHEDPLDEIVGEHIDLNASYGSLLSGRDFQESLVYESLPIDAKLRALANPQFMSHLDPARREEIKERLEIQQSIRETTDAARNLSSVTSSMANILTRTGVVEAEDARRANDAAHLVSSAAIAVVGCYAVEMVSCLSGVSGTVTGLSNLFGGGSGSSEAGALLEGQRKLLEGQRILMEGQRELLEGQLAARQELRDAHQDVLENRLALLERADAIDRRLTRGFDDVQRTLGAVLWEIGQLGSTLIDFSEFGTQLRECEDFVGRRALYDFNAHVAYVPRTVEFPLGEFAAWRPLEQHYAANWEHWRPCLRTIRDLFSRRQIYGDVHSVLRLSIYPGPTTGATLLTDYVNPGFAPLVQLMSRHYPLQADAAGMRTFCALLNSRCRMPESICEGQHCSPGNPAEAARQRVHWTGSGAGTVTRPLSRWTSGFCTRTRWWN